MATLSHIQFNLRRFCSSLLVKTHFLAYLSVKRLSVSILRWPNVLKLFLTPLPLLNRHVLAVWSLWFEQNSSLFQFCFWYDFVPFLWIFLAKQLFLAPLPRLKFHFERHSLAVIELYLSSLKWLFDAPSIRLDFSLSVQEAPILSFYFSQVIAP